MARLTGGEALAKQLHREGVRVVFGLPGVQLYGAMAGLRDEPNVRFITHDTFGSTHGSDEARILAELPANLKSLQVDAVISGMGC